MMVHPATDALDDQPHRLAVHRRETLDPEDPVRLGGARDLAGERLR